MDNLFRPYRTLNENDYKQLWENGLFIFDTNTLLDLYRLPTSARKDLINILTNKKINGRVWIPFQVILEFMHNKVDAISDQKNKFNNVKSIITEKIAEINAIQDSLASKLNELQLKKRHSVINPDKYVNENWLKEPIRILNEFLIELDSLNERQPEVNDEDKIFERVAKIFKGKIGSGFTKDELEQIYKEGEQRYKDNIPPGYKDKSKEGFYVFEDKRHVRKFGDLIAWKEIIKKIQENGLEYVILVTGDTKEDWWQEKRGRKLGPRYELLNEIYFLAAPLKIFHMYDTSSFMQYAKQHLKIKVKEQSIKEAKDIIEFNRPSNPISTLENDIISIKDFIKQVGKDFRVRIRFSGGFENAPFILIPSRDLFPVFLEILANVQNHSLDNTVTVRIKVEDDFIVLKFKNLVKTNADVVRDEMRGKGIQFISSIVNPVYGYVETELGEKEFQIRIYIDKIYTSLNSSIKEVIK